MSTLNSEIVINLSGNLSQKARTYSNDMKKFAASQSHMAKGFRHVVKGVNKGLDAMENRYTALVATVAGGAVANRLVTLDRRLSRLSVAADLTKEQTRALYEEIENISRSEGIRIDPTQTLEGLEVVMEKLGDIDFARQNMGNIALFSQATGATGGHIGAVLTQLKKLSVETQQDVMTAMDTLNVQGKRARSPWPRSPPKVSGCCPPMPQQVAKVLRLCLNWVPPCRSFEAVQALTIRP